MIRRLTACAAAPLIVGLGIAVAAPASASPGQENNSRTAVRVAVGIHTDDAAPTSGSCNLVAPATARVTDDFSQIPVQVTGDCASQAGLKAIWYSGPSLNYSTDAITVESPDAPIWYLFGDTQLGTRTWNGWVAADADNHLYAQNAPKTTVKVASYAGLHTSHADGKTTINTRVLQYSTGQRKNIPYAGATGVIQYRPVGGSAWSGLKNVVANSQGLYDYRYATSQAREYRVVYNESTYIWGTTSSTSKS